jgi:hypothetical protein
MARLAQTGRRPSSEDAFGRQRGLDDDRSREPAKRASRATGVRRRARSSIRGRSPSMQAGTCSSGPAGIARSAAASGGSIGGHHHNGRRSRNAGILGRRRPGQAHAAARRHSVRTARSTSEMKITGAFAKSYSPVGEVVASQGCRTCPGHGRSAARTRLKPSALAASVPDE